MFISINIFGFSYDQQFALISRFFFSLFNKRVKYKHYHHPPPSLPYPVRLSRPSDGTQIRNGPRLLVLTSLHRALRPSSATRKPSGDTFGRQGHSDDRCAWFNTSNSFFPAEYMQLLLSWSTVSLIRFTFFTFVRLIIINLYYTHVFINDFLVM